ncbi:MAG: hypothetical protein RMH84_03575 [Sulfolobales archaeon]|nr:storkhead-box protein [Sulfolobales archaeon]MCX8208028.1 storkhead-box protein [Sulfolobales archaeon]MDW8010656.1 hypothetical protein [Sulfolobales archaeon]
MEKKKNAESNESEKSFKLDLNLRVVYEDQEVLVIRAPTEDELVDIILKLLNTKPMNIKEIHQYLPGIASEDKIRKTLTKLVNEGRVYVLENGRFIVVGR